jgi:hypothetical protein
MVTIAAILALPALAPFGLFAPKYFKLFGYQLLEIVPEKQLAH